MKCEVVYERALSRKDSICFIVDVRKGNQKITLSSENGCKLSTYGILVSPTNSPLPKYRPLIRYWAESHYPDFHTFDIEEHMTAARHQQVRGISVIDVSAKPWKL